MYTLMKSEQIKFGNSATGPRAYEQKEVGQYVEFETILAACSKANRQLKARHYVMNDSGKEYYADSWID